MTSRGQSCTCCDATTRPETINVGTGTDVTIRDLAELIAEVVGYEGETVWDASKPDGTPRKLLDIGRLRSLGWEASTQLPEGLARTYQQFVPGLTTRASRFGT